MAAQARINQKRLRSIVEEAMTGLTQSHRRTIHAQYQTFLGTVFGPTPFGLQRDPTLQSLLAG